LSFSSEDATVLLITNIILQQPNSHRLLFPKQIGWDK